MSEGTSEWSRSQPLRPGPYWFCGRIWGGAIELKVVELLRTGHLAVYGQMVGASNFDGIWRPIPLPPQPTGELAQVVAEMRKP
jgi:hypothetical protein